MSILCDYENNIYFNGDLDYDEIDDLIKTFIDRQEEYKKFSCINLHIETPGGQVQSVLKLIQIIKNQLKNNNIELNTYNDSYCNSSGILLFLAGNRRFINENSTFLMHPISLHLNENYYRLEELKEKIEIITQTEKIYKDMLSYYSNNLYLIKLYDELSKMSKSFLIESKEALKYNIATDVINYL